LTLAIDGVAGSSLDEKIVSGEGDQGTLPGSISKGSLSLEDDLKLSDKIFLPKQGNLHEFHL
jgi:hypothetical protein